MPAGVGGQQRQARTGALLKRKDPVIDWLKDEGKGEIQQERRFYKAQSQ